MATACPWGTHGADPDPAASKRPVGFRGLCRRCFLRYVVASTSPYRLDRAVGHSASLIFALSSVAKKPAMYRALLEDPVVRRTLRRRGVL
jgi:hypothetical protein